MPFTELAAAQSVMIATPTIDGKLDYRYVQPLIESSGLLRSRGVQWELAMEVGNSLIADARNLLLAQFVASKHTDMVFIDADIAWEAQGLLRLLSWDVPLVAGAYARKAPQLSFAVHFGTNIEGRHGGLVSAERVATGFMRLRRDCVERMMSAWPQLALSAARPVNGSTVYALFDTGVVDGKYYGEDYLFCDRWRKSGGEVLVDPSLRLRHIGTRIWDATLADHLRPN